MDALKAVGIGVGVVVVVLLVSPYLIQSMVKGSDHAGAGAMGVIGDLFHPVQKDATVQLQMQAEKGEDEADGQGDDPEGDPVDESDEPVQPETSVYDLPWELRP